MKKLKLMDMHIHTIHSDGNHTVSEIISMAHKNNISTIAITDHDTITGSQELVSLKPKNITIYSGLELTIRVSKGRMHILGYNVDLENPTLNSLMTKLQENSIYNILLYIEVLKSDYNIVLPEFEISQLLSQKGNIGRPQIALLLLKYNHCQTVDEAFDLYLRPAYKKVNKLKKGLTKEEGISVINSSGGVAVLAHPNSLELNNQELEEEIAYLQEIGLAGLETQHPNESIAEREFYHELALKYYLLESGGTDYHGEKVKPDIELGTGRHNNIFIPENTLTLTKAIKSRY